MRPSEDRVVAFDLPGLNRCHVEAERPDRAAQEEDESKEDKRVCQDKEEEMDKLIHIRAEILDLYSEWCRRKKWSGDGTYAGQTSFLPQNGAAGVQEAF